MSLYMNRNRLAVLMAAALLILSGCSGQEADSSSAGSSAGLSGQSADISSSAGSGSPGAYTDKDVVNAYINDSRHLILVLKDQTEIDAGIPEDGKMPPISYMVTFQDYDGTVLSSVPVLIGQSVLPPTPPQREGHEFAGWDGSYSNVRENRLLTARYRQVGSEEKAAYTVTFLDRDGSVLETQVVEDGQTAGAPQTPEWPGFIFRDWDKDFQEVRSDLTVTAQYEMDRSMTVYAEHLTAAPGDTVVMPVRIKNNSGVLSLHMLLQYQQSGLELTELKSGEAFSMLDFVPHGGELVSGSGVIWSKVDIDPKEVRDGEILLMTFHVADNAAKGTYPVTFVCKDVLDRALKPLELNLVGGSITVK